MVLIRISLVISDAEHLFMFLLAVCMLWKDVCSGPLPILKSDVFSLLSCVGSLCIFYVSLLLDKWFADIFLPVCKLALRFVAGVLGSAEAFGFYPVVERMGHGAGSRCRTLCVRLSVAAQ